MLFDFNMYEIAVQLSIVLLAALIGGIISYRFRQPLVVGYLVIGVILGNLLPKSIIQSSAVSFFGDLGVALLLFSLGLEFSIKKVSSVGKIAIVGGVLQIIISALLGFLILPLFMGTLGAESIFVAFLVAFSSTAVVAKILAERGALDSLYGEILLGWLIIQDIAILPLMALFPLFVGGVTLPFKDIFLLVLKPLLVLYVVFLLGRKIVPKLFVKLALLHNRELMVLLSFVFCILFSLGALQLGLSFALGAFLAGICLSASGVNEEVFSEIKSIRDIFAAVFFVSLGFLVNTPFLLSHIPVVLAVLVIILLVKFAIVFGLVLYMGYHSKVAFLVGVGLVQIGEFSFVLAKLGLDKNVLSSSAFQIILSSAVLTIILTPFLFSKAEFFYEKIRKMAKSRLPRLYEKVFVRFDDLALYAPKDELKKMSDHVILIGYGRVGRAVARILDTAKVNYVVIDLNYQNLKYPRNRGVPNIFGDAEDEEVLKLARLDRAKILVIAKPGMYENEHILKRARWVNPNIKVIMRVHSENEAAHFVIEGVKDVVEPEFTASVEMAQKALFLLGFDKESIEGFMKELKDEHRY